MKGNILVLLIQASALIVTMVTNFPSKLSLKFETLMILILPN